MLESFIEQLRLCKPLSENSVYDLCEMVKEVLIEKSNVLSVPLPVTVVGDVHGQFYDVLELFRIGGEPPHTNYLFLGDYVDRGYFSVETISLLMCFMLKWPDRVQMLRGNHESRDISSGYGFYDECLKKYGSPHVWGLFMETFDYLSIAAVISDNIFAVHGGLSPSIHTIDQIRILDRFVELPLDGPLADLLWSDPDEKKNGFTVNPRNVGYTFGVDVLSKFLYVNGVGQVVRAHQMCMDGFVIQLSNCCVTVWSAPNYCYRCGNDAAILEMDEHGTQFANVFNEAPPHARQVPPSEADSKDAPDYFL